MTIPGDIVWASLPVPVLIVDADDRIVQVNAPSEQFLNASARILAGAPVLDRLAIDAPLEEAFRRVRASLSPVFINNADVSGGNAAPVQCNIQIAPLAGMADHILLLLEPRQLAGRPDHAGSGAKSAIGMAEMLAHEIKNPLAGITGAAQLLSMNMEGGDLELADLIVAESRRIVALLDQVEQFGNLRPPECRAVNVHDLLDRARRSALVGFAAGMRIERDFDPSLPPILVDADLLLQVFLNLLKNAAEAAGGGRAAARNGAENGAGNGSGDLDSPPDHLRGTIRIRTFYDASLRLRRAGGQGGALPLQVEIIDDGPGIPEDLRGDIFEPFVSGRQNGTGLGLALVGKIIADHGGWITVETVPGRTVFRLSLPVAPKGADSQ